MKSVQLFQLSKGGQLWWDSARELIRGEVPEKAIKDESKRARIKIEIEMNRWWMDGDHKYLSKEKMRF